MKRRIAVVTTSRADYSHLVWPLRELSQRPGVDLRIIAMAAHLSPEFGASLREIEADGFQVHEKVECLLSSDTDVGMARTIGIATQSLAEALDRQRPDILLLIADRYELLAPAVTALALRIPIAHIEGGEISAGAIDDAVRNAITKLAHVHFTPTAAARARVLAMGEESWRVHRVGAPSLDHLRKTSIPSRAEVFHETGLAVDAETILVAWHPVTLKADTLEETEALFQAVAELLPRFQVVFSFPNADAGSRSIIRRAEEAMAAGNRGRVIVNLPPEKWFALLGNARFMLGNSSSGIMEAPAFRLPVVNVGIRQEGRERARNIIDVPAEKEAILAGVRQALDPRWRESLTGMENPYGDGRAAERIADVLESVPLGETLLFKRALPLDEQGCWRREHEDDPPRRP